ncbi:2-keto-4-pentenoate hydratase [Parahaliea mediterranea]|uniref:Fumarylacetoacetate hydrolase family protein n=1 Tax=Parahaliea mediterranea TaxID=651086 RepID=A0A939IK43_9GAMM|nr:fumarylacetoacetate hydrolase family protein [Parahaliea mediterranea]MBN7796951.1 fumarylacetoacetate hydrolase family protein [Parahaliea mediterranea]
MLTEQIRGEIASGIYRCFQQGGQLPLLNTTYPDMEMEDAYRIQERVVGFFKDAGRRVKGYKIGLTSKAMQEMAGTSEPDYSAILDHMFLPESSSTPRADWASPLVEIEMAFVMKHRLSGPGVNVAEVIRATDFVLPAIEIVDFRVAPGPGMDVRDTIADLAAVGGVVLGGNPRKLEDIDIRSVRGDLLINDVPRESGCAAEVLGNPLTAVAWLANKLADFDITFEPGDVILSGSFLRALPVEAGDDVVARFDNGFGDIRLSFT